MRKTESLAGVLDRWPARVQSGAATVEDCLREYPELADQLGPLLLTARQAGDLLAPSGPTAAYRAASEARLLNRLRAAQVVDQGERSRVIDRPVRRRSFAGLGRPRAWRPAYALAGLALALALIGSGLGGARAAGGLRGPSADMEPGPGACRPPGAAGHRADAGADETRAGPGRGSPPRPRARPGAARSAPAHAVAGGGGERLCARPGSEQDARPPAQRDPRAEG